MTTTLLLLGRTQIDTTQLSAQAHSVRVDGDHWIIVELTSSTPLHAIEGASVRTVGNRIIVVPTFSWFQFSPSGLGRTSVAINTANWMPGDYEVCVGGQEGERVLTRFSVGAESLILQAR